MAEDQTPNPDHNIQSPGRWQKRPDLAPLGLSLLMLIAQPLIFYRNVLFQPQMHIPFDIEGFHLPLAAYIGRCVREGVLPFWDPYPLCGVPFHADLQTQLYYPITWIAILLGNLSAGRDLFYWIEWLVPAHMILAGLFTFLLLRHFGVRPLCAFLGGTVYQLGGYFASQAQHLGAISCAAWLPLTLLCVLQLSRGARMRWIALLAASVALAVLCGSAAAALVVFGAAGMLTIALGLASRSKRNFLGAVSAGFLLGLGMTAIQVIPTYQLAGKSAALLRYEWHKTGGGLPVQSLASLVAPNYYHIFTPSDPSLYKMNLNYTLLYVYCGIMPLALVLVAPFLRRAPYARMMCLFTVISVIWMLGDRTPLYRGLYTHLPNLLRGALYAELALAAFCMFVALTSALAFERIAGRWPVLLVWGLALLTSADLMYFGSERPMNAQPPGYERQSSEHQILGDAQGLQKLQALVNIANPPLRIDYLDRDFWPGILGAEMLRLPTADGDSPFILKRILLLRRIFGSGPAWERQLPVARASSPLISMLNIGFIGSHAGLAPGRLREDRLEPVYDSWGFRFYRIPDPLPRFFLVHRLHISTGKDETFSYLARAGFAPAEEAVVEAADLRPGESLSNGTVRVECYSANRIVLNVQTEGRAFLASSEVLYPGWTVAINGKGAHFYMTNGAFRGVMLNPGANRIVMTYWPERYLAWAAISTVTTLLVIAGLIFGGSFRAPGWLPPPAGAR